MSVDWTKPILWDGKPARLLATDLKGFFPYAVAVDRGDDQGEVIVKTNHKGFCSSAHATPLVCMLTNVPERVERWVNVYGTGCVSFPHKTRSDADRSCENRTNLLHLTFENSKLVDVAIVPLAGAADA